MDFVTAKLNINLCPDLFQLHEVIVLHCVVEEFVVLCGLMLSVLTVVPRFCKRF